MNRDERSAPTMDPPQEEAAPEEAQQEDDGMLEIEKARRQADEKFMENYKSIDMSELIATGSVSFEVEICEGMTVGLRTLTEEEDTAALNDIYNIDGTGLYVRQILKRHLLSRAVKTINGREFAKDHSEAFEKISKISKVISEAIYQEYIELIRALTIKIKGHSGNSLERLLIGQE